MPAEDRRWALTSKKASSQLGTCLKTLLIQVTSYPKTTLIQRRSYLSTTLVAAAFWTKNSAPVTRRTSTQAASALASLRSYLAIDLELVTWDMNRLAVQVPFSPRSNLKRGFMTATQSLKRQAAQAPAKGQSKTSAPGPRTAPNPSPSPPGRRSRPQVARRCIHRDHRRSLRLHQASTARLSRALACGTLLHARGSARRPTRCPVAPATVLSVRCLYRLHQDRRPYVQRPPNPDQGARLQLVRVGHSWVRLSCIGLAQD